jgi:chromosome segregation ATPase
MQIVRLASRNIKAIKYVEIVPNRTVTIVGGRNASGKSSLLDSIAMALGGKKLCPARPIRKGESEAYVEVELDGEPARLIPACTVRRDFWLKKDGELGTRIEIVTKDGYTAPSPQTMLGDIVGVLGFDPESFLRMTPKEQAEILRNLVGLDFSDLDQERARIYRERATVNDAGKRLKVQYDAMPHHPEAPEEEVSAAALVSELQARRQHNAENAKARSSLDRQLIAFRQQEELVRMTARQLADLEAAVIKARDALAEEQARAEKLDAELKSATAACESLVDQNTEEVEQQIVDSERINKQVRENAKRADAAARLEEERRRSAALTKEIEAIDDQKERARQAAKWPVPGLGYDDTGVTYNGLPFDQISASEQRRVAVGIACALNPSLKFFFLKDGSLLDDNAKVEFAQLAAEHGCQCFLEVVGDGSEANIVIEEGEVVRADEGMLVPQTEGDAT